MPFKQVISTVYTGQPSNGQAKLQIWLKDGTCLTVTDGWSGYPEYEYTLHCDHLPERVVRARDDLAQELRTSGRRGTSSMQPRLFRYTLPSGVAIGNKILVTVRYGQWSEHRLVRFDSPVIRFVIP